MTEEDKNGWSAVRDVQHGQSPTPPSAIPLIGAHEILAMFPPAVQLQVSTKWVRANVPGKVRIGRSYVWPTRKVLEFLNSGSFGDAFMKSKQGDPVDTG